MPVVSYYLGRLARFWIAVMSGAELATVGNPTAATPQAARNRPWQRPGERMPEEPGAGGTRRPGSYGCKHSLAFPAS
jgi:hypothetical protein